MGVTGAGLVGSGDRIGDCTTGLGGGDPCPGVACGLSAEGAGARGDVWFAWGGDSVVLAGLGATAL